LEYFGAYPAQAFSWAVHVENVSLRQGRILFGGRAVIGGFPNVDGSILQTGTEKQIKDYAAELIAEAGPIGVMIGADCTIPATTEIKRLKWVREACRLK
jgi:uroporphyrinogen decarboxylase